MAVFFHRFRQHPARGDPLQGGTAHGAGRDFPRLSNETIGTIEALCRAGALPKYLAGEFREAFQVSPGEVALERGCLKR